ncbi:MAG: hypothetical protein B0A82_19970 [Alkalinema sp. CACIAM 70d]|nr:MAG: hypothetical protein B0A82_19970 [Alkalinema sp. CACIAM 70d]
MSLIRDIHEFIGYTLCMNSRNEQVLAAKRPGPKPIGSTAMTATERKRRSRAAKQAEGYAEFVVTAKGLTLNSIDALAFVGNQTRSEVVAWLLEDALSRLTVTMTAIKATFDGGGSEDQAREAGEKAATFVGIERAHEIAQEVLGKK